MNIPTLKTPWQKKSNQGSRYSPDPYYRSYAWKSLRDLHRAGFTVVNGFKLPNDLCIMCYRDHGIKALGPNCDHIIQRKEGGKDELSNLQSLCAKHHAAKSASERNQKYKK